MTADSQHNRLSELRSRAVAINLLSTGLDNGANSLASVPGLLRQILAEGSWRHFITMREEEVRHEDFHVFLTTPPLKGLGASEDVTRRLVDHDVALLNLLDQHLAEASGCPASTPQEDEPNLPDGPSPRPLGATRAAALRKLGKHAPHLLEEVTIGSLSVNKALIEAGLRERTVSVPVSRPDKAADVLRRHFTPAQLADLAQLLTD
ncbi:hypothetical protein [Streptomyces chrestomyceticus]|uniref:hypothetical protein n=1 Tax=Streptomyces chrestomyceticus TaxID=68185 RepID=UPI0035A94B02